MAFVKTHRKRLFLVVTVAQLVYLLFMPATRAAAMLLVHAVLSGRYVPCVLLAPCLLAFGVLFNQRLKALNWRWLEWSPFHVKANLALIPLEDRWLWAPYALLLATCMPLLAFFEEVIFRSGTNNWIRGILWGALAFGLFHLVSFVSIRMTIYLSIVGAVLVQVYMLDGLLAVFVVHAVYNLLALTLLVGEAHMKRSPALIRAAGARLAALSLARP